MKRSDIFYMRHALGLAVRSSGRTSPNPMVGAVVVKGDRIIAEGYHKRAGLAHAEVIALRRAGARARGARLYVTLEPCAHYGRTPPCVDRVIASGVREVIVAMRDPNPLTNGRGIHLLKQRGITVRVGVCADEARRINAPFIKYITTGLPYVTVKIAQSLDGKVSSRTRHSQWITSARSRELAHRQRQNFDAIMAGIGTVLADDPCLAASGTRQPVKVIADTRLRTPVNARLFSGNARVFILTNSRKKKRYPAATTIVRTRIEGRHLDLRDGLKRLAQMGITSLLVEGGATLTGSIFDKQLADAVMVYMSPKIIGGIGALSSVGGRGVDAVTRAPVLKEIRVSRSGQDLLIEGVVSYVHRDH